MCCPIDPEQFLVRGARGPREGVLGHVQAVGLTTGDHQQRLLDQVDLIRRIPTHQIQQAAGGVLEGRAGTGMRPPVVLVALSIHLERQRGDLLIRHVGIAGIENRSAGLFLGACVRRLLQTLLDRIQLRISKSIATNPSGVEHAERRNRLEAFVGLCHGQ